MSDLLPYGYTVVVVDDGSLTPAREALQGLDVYSLRHNVNLGQGAALQTGNEFALKNGAEVVVHFDADGQHSASLVERLVAPILRGEVEVTFGSRFLNPVDRRDVPARKRLLLKLGVFISWVFTKVWLSDTHNGFRALSRTAAERVPATRRQVCARHRNPGLSAITFALCGDPNQGPVHGVLDAERAKISEWRQHRS